MSLKITALYVSFFQNGDQTLNLPNNCTLMQGKAEKNPEFTSDMHDCGLGYISILPVI